ncbi:hypothetical protein CDO46_19655 [Pigmentiphaga sp. NML030171]|uniref:FecR protein domain-containing protein n=1 Tax=Pigmentiphaga daeguensis TaxID=414049 RepID=A0ABP3L5W7_9BURK|nr:FecR domain-containing protein [Pigmentiphaga sp. NML030171]OVZ61588.1 hypothetical protein CDO46_19655 [Pigmentiphaga sp. NML030171]
MSLPSPRTPSTQPRPWKRWLGWACLALALGLTGALTVSWVMRESSPQFGEQLRTEGQARSLELPDGSRIDAGPGTSLSVAYYSRRRQVILARGEASFHVRWQYRAAFSVQWGVNEVVIDGTRIETPDILFRVAAEPERLRVELVEGALKVRTVTAGPREFVELQPGDALTVDMGTRTHQLTHASPAPAR